MPARTTRAVIIALCIVAFWTSCNRKKPPVPVMLPPPVPVELPQQQKPPPPPPELPPPKTDTTTPPAVVTESETKMPGPPKKRHRRVRKAHKKEDEATQTAEDQTPEAAASDATAAPAMQLGQMLSDQQRQEYESHINDSLGRARANVARAQKRTNLTAAQQRMVSQVTTFIEQAEERRKTDLVSSRSLAERADLLSRDLVESLR